MLKAPSEHVPYSTIEEHSCLDADTEPSTTDMNDKQR